MISLFRENRSAMRLIRKQAKDLEDRYNLLQWKSVCTNRRVSEVLRPCQITWQGILLKTFLFITSLEISLTISSFLPCWSLENKLVNNLWRVPNFFFFFFLYRSMPLCSITPPSKLLISGWLYTQQDFK